MTEVVEDFAFCDNFIQRRFQHVSEYDFRAGAGEYGTVGCDVATPFADQGAVVAFA